MGENQFINLLFLHLNDIWRESIYPDQWALSLMNQLYKGDGKDREDPASYRGIFLSNAMLKPFEDCYKLLWQLSIAVLMLPEDRSMQVHAAHICVSASSFTITHCHLLLTYPQTRVPAPSVTSPCTGVIATVPPFFSIVLPRPVCFPKFTNPDPSHNPEIPNF